MYLKILLSYRTFTTQILTIIKFLTKEQIVFKLKVLDYNMRGYIFPKEIGIYNLIISCFLVKKIFIVANIYQICVI